jgi:diguanylate cyclase (GGDEF)-like protein
MKRNKTADYPGEELAMSTMQSTIEPASDPGRRQRRIIRLLIPVLWLAALGAFASQTAANPTVTNIAMLVAMFGLFAMVNVRLFVSRWAGRRHWRVISSKLHGSTYISELHDLPNRNYLLAELRREMPQSRSHGTAFTLIHLEIDDVEGLRGRRGTGFVDRTLSSVTDLLQRITRSSDFVAYLGDAKFAVLLNECTREQSFLYLRRIPGAISVSDGRHMLDVKMTARVSQYDMEALYATDVLREAEEVAPLRRKEEPRHWSEAA